MAGIPELLDSLAGSMHAVGTAADTVGQVITATVEPSPDMVDVTEIVNGPVNLTWITKDVLFTSPDPEQSFNLDDLAGQISGDLTASSKINGVLNQIQGTVPMLNTLRLPLSVTVEWTALDENQMPLAQTEFTVLSDLTGGKEISMAFLPDVVELTQNASPPAPKKRFLRATVTLGLGSQTKTVDLPDLPVLVPALAIPKVLAAFIHPNFQAKQNDDDGGVFLMVPANSPFRKVEQLKSTLSSLQAAASALKSLGTFAGFLLGVSDLVGALTATTYFAFAAEDSVPDLNQYILIQNDLVTNNIELEDELSSMIFIGPAGKTVECYCETDYEDEDGRLDLTTGPGHVTVVRSLRCDPTAVPATEPPGTAINQAASTNGDEGFNDWLSSLKFV